MSSEVSKLKARIKELEELSQHQLHGLWEKDAEIRDIRRYANELETRRTHVRNLLHSLVDAIA